MRYLFLLLLVINLGYWSWESFLRDLVQSTRPAASEQIVNLNPEGPTLKLTSELPTTTASNALPAAPVTPPPAEQVQAPALGACYVLSQHDEEVITNAVTWLQSQRIPTKTLPLPSKAVRDYRAWIPPLENNTAAREMLARLKAQQIDAFIIPTGEEKNGISLGVFSRMKDAKDHVQYMKKKGYPAEVNPRYRGTPLFKLQAGDSTHKVTEITLKNLIQQIPNLEKEEIDCR